MGDTMRIAIDVDSTSCEVNTGFLERLNQKYCSNFCVEDIDSWNPLLEHNGECISWYDNIIEALSSPGFMVNAPIVEGVDEAIKELSKKHYIFFLTSRRDAFIPDTKTWVKNNFGDYEVISAKGKQHFMDKFDILIDDSPLEIQAISALGGKVIIFDSPWNRVEFPNNPIRKTNWKDIVEYINSM
jgi:5'(3')-deoxyribonucleotidase